MLEMVFNEGPTGCENAGFQHRAHTPTFLTIIFVFHNSVRGKEIRNYFHHKYPYVEKANKHWLIYRPRKPEKRKSDYFVQKVTRESNRCICKHQALKRVFLFCTEESQLFVTVLWQTPFNLETIIKFALCHFLPS